MGKSSTPPSTPPAPAPPSEPQTPRFAGFQNSGNGILTVQFDRTGATVTPADIKDMFPGRNIRVTEFPQNILSPHLRKFRIDVFDEKGRISYKVANEMEKEIGGGFHDWPGASQTPEPTPEPWSAPKSSQESFTPESRVFPRFGSSRQKMTVPTEEMTPPPGTKIILDGISQEQINHLRKSGYVVGGVTPEGKVFMTFGKKPSVAPPAFKK